MHMRLTAEFLAMRRPVIGVIANAYQVENRFPTQLVGERNLRAVADVAGALPLMFAGRRKSPISVRCWTWSMACC